MPTFFDSHVHLDMLAEKGIDPRKALDDARAAGVTGMVTIAGAMAPGETQQTFSLVAGRDSIGVAVGIHPHAADRATPDVLSRLERDLGREQVVAVGEIGLDYYYNFCPPQDQRRAFVAQMRMARQMGLPVVIHTRSADEDTIVILEDEGVQETGGVIHCFSSDQIMADRALALGMYISFSGIVTFPGAVPVAEAAQMVPTDRILAETDAPFLSPVPLRGRVNEPARVVHVVARLAQLRGVDEAAMGEQVTANAAACFKMKV